jgi:alanyl-tRNA synthetase
VAKGIRRIVALTGDAAEAAQEAGEELLHRLQSVEAAGQDAETERLQNEVSALNNALNEQTLPLRVRNQLRTGVGRLQEIIKKLEKQKTEDAEAQVVESARQIADEAEGPVIIEKIENADGKTLPKAMDVLRKKRPDCAMLLAGAGGEKVAFVAAVPEAMQAQGLKAGDWVGEVAKVVGGGGGGKPDKAQAGGKDPSKIDEALDKAREVAAAKVS